MKLAPKQSPLGRGALLGMPVGFALGCIGGLVEAVNDYPLSSWFGVTLYVGFLGMLVGLVVGSIGGTIVMSWRKVRHAVRTNK